MNALTTVAPALSFDDLERLGTAIAKSGLFGMKTPDQAIAIMAIAQAEGRHPALAARDYDIINGRAAKKSEAMHRDFLQAGGSMKWHTLTDTEADATFSHPVGGEVRITWDMERAKVAGFAGKENYKKYPRQMLRARTVSEGVRTVWPLATSGMYVPEEAADIPAKAEPFGGPTVEHEAQSGLQVGQSALNQAGLQVGQSAAMNQQDLRSAYNTAVPMKAAAASVRAERIVDPTVYEADPQEQPRPRTRGSFLDALEIALRDAQSAEEVDRIVCGEDSMRAKETFEGAHKERYTKLVDAALKKWWHEPPAGEDLPDVEIAGSEKVMSG